MPLYPYQERVKTLVQAGQSVILQAPTGAGKTRAALTPFLDRFFTQEAQDFPRKCIYSVPMRVLANQFVAEYDKLAARHRRVFDRLLIVGIQTGDRPDDPKVERNLVFTTVDQTLSNFLNIPYGVGGGSANLNAGAVVGSYLVFDELHLYDPDTMLPTTLEMLRLLRGITPFVIMTATFSSTMLGRLAALLGAVVVPGDAAERQGMAELASQQGKSRVFTAIDQPLTAGAVLDPARRGLRTICICNTVASAQRLYQELREGLAQAGDSHTQLCLLHSRFYKTDRDAKEDWVRAQFGTPQSEYAGPPLILVATQVIEVGVDATSDVLHSEVAPAAALLQRAGRCARRPDEQGRVYIYLPRDEQGDPDYTPYFLKGQSRATERGRRLCEATWAALQSSEFTGQHMSFAREQALIDVVHTPIDTEILDEMASNRLTRRDDMLRTMQTQARGMSTELIRESTSCFVFPHPEPQADEKLVRNPWHYDGFAFAPGTLAKAFTTMLDEGAEVPWIMQTAAVAEEETATTLEEEAPARQARNYRWYPLESGKEVYTSAVLAVHPALVSYDTELGMRFAPSAGDLDPRERPGRRGRPAYGYRRETFAEHVAGLYRAYRETISDPGTGLTYLPLAVEMAAVARRLEQRHGLPSGAIDQMVRACFACHDLGKLNVAWQKWAHQWQAEVGRFYPNSPGGQAAYRLPPSYMAAHTDFEPTTAQKEAQRRLGPRPPHAGESAMAAGTLLEQLCGEYEGLWRAAMTAIARHHNAATDSHRAYQSHPVAQAAFDEALGVVGLDAGLAAAVWWTPDKSTELSPCLVGFDAQGIPDLLLYFVLVRTLRLADQRSQIDHDV